MAAQETPTLPPIMSVEDLVREKDLLGITDAKLCDEAGIAVTTFGRWKRNDFGPNMTTWRKVVEALHRLAAISENTAGAAE